MKERLLCCIFIAFMTFSILTGCKQELDVADNKPYDSAYFDVSQFYVQYLELMIHDAAQAAQFCYFEDESAKDLFLQSVQENPTTSYEVIRFEKLSNLLWVVETRTTNGIFPNGIYGVNYVGIVGNNMLVYRNSKQLPNALTEGLEIEDYEIHGPDVLK